MKSCTAVYAIKIQHTHEPDTNQQLAAFHLSPAFYAGKYLQELSGQRVKWTLEFSNIKRDQRTHALLNAKHFLSFLYSLAWVGIDDICALRFAEGTEAPMDVFGSNSKMVGGARLELGQCTGHWERKGFQHPDLLPVLLCCIIVRVILVESVEMIAVYGRARLISLCHTPGQHDTGLTGHQLQLRLLRRRGFLCLWT